MASITLLAIIRSSGEIGIRSRLKICRPYGFVGSNPTLTTNHVGGGMRIICNSIKCLKCFSVIESVHVHDFIYCKCGNIAVDGGKEYLKRIGLGVSDNSYVELSLQQ
jgi:hypothetical protein